MFCNMRVQNCAFFLKKAKITLGFLSPIIIGVDSDALMSVNTCREKGKMLKTGLHTAPMKFFQ